MKNGRCFVLAGLLMIFFSLTGNVWAKDNQLTLKGGYHVWANSGQTFRDSEKGDKEFNGPCYALEYTRFVGKNFSLSSSLCKYKQIKEKIFPNYKFVCDVAYLDITARMRKKIGQKLDMYVGVGPGIYWNDLEQNGKQIEYHTGLGGHAVLGVNHRLSEKWGLMAECRYAFNKWNSEKWRETTWDTAGLFYFTGITLNF